ncbi:MAG: DUF2089 family protein [Cyclobacteriaceae bacterium]|nr:DUF2089 family protein [Cyclobacteriaceae bacterium]
MGKKLPIVCPSCNSDLKVQSLHCEKCSTTIGGQFELPVLLRLEEKEQDFILDFVQCSGSLKIMALKLGLSYPTVRNMLDDLISKIENLQNHD